MRSNKYWTTPPGSSARRASPRRIARTVVGSFLVGVLSVGVAWAGAGLIPVGNSTSNPGSGDKRNWLQEEQGESSSDSEAATGQLESLQANQVYAGAHKVNIAPNPTKYSGVWETRQAHCETMANPQETEPEHIPDFRVRWHENTNCIYTGGFDLGPEHAVSAFDKEYELWARATAISDGNDTVVLLILDASYYFAKYANMCNTVETHKSVYDGEGPGANSYTQDCGFRDLQNSMAAKFGYTGPNSRGQFGIEPASFFLASSHAHAAPDFIGAWGGVPRWYMQQVEDSIREAVYGAIGNLQPTYLEAGEILYRGGNNSRRRHYHAAEEAGASWMRFVAEEQADPICTTPAPAPTPTEHVPPGQQKKETPAPAPTPTCTQPPPNRNAIATIGTYAAHPVNSSNGTAYADLSGVFAKRAEERFGGIGLYFQTGFGNMTSNGSRVALGNNLVQLLPDVGQGPQVTGDLDVRTLMRTFDQPVTNSALAGGGISGIFDRPMEPRPSAISISKNSLRPGDEPRPQDTHGPHKRCNSASPVTVNSQVSVARIGPANGGLLITGGPGELFSNYTNTIKEKNLGGVTFPLSLVNDGLGYIMQSVETDHVGRQAIGFVNGPFSEYEDAYSIDACFGDHALEQTLAGINQI
ncbi:MAG: hypothetical protein M3238_06130 [Actinomycetota bacterium]|nr:hypothetical protein [Actinomycetota bacterium]